MMVLSSAGRALPAEDLAAANFSTAMFAVSVLRKKRTSDRPQSPAPHVPLVAISPVNGLTVITTYFAEAPAKSGPANPGYLGAPVAFLNWKSSSFFHFPGSAPPV